MKKSNNNVFWVSYSDLLTSLFFVMFVLFVVALGYLLEQNQGVKDENERLKKILQIEEQFKPLIESGTFIYLEECRKYVAKEFQGIEIFTTGEDKILDNYKISIRRIGSEIEGMLKKLHENNPDLTYLLVIEGNTANNHKKSFNQDSNHGYMLSYKRALAVYQLWYKNGINLRKYNTEIVICGSGFNGICRDKDEENNKRFSIQIIPKVKEIKQEIN